MELKRRRIIPLPVGMKVTIKWYEYHGLQLVESSRTGFINKQMFPGYSYKNTNIEDMRYGITDIKDPNHSWIVTERWIISPDMSRIYFDKEYESNVINSIHRFNDTNRNHSSSINNSGYKVKERNSFRVFQKSIKR